ncbi:MAG: hypothetical protein OEW35_06675 [Gammaproteobacteria bacterium]|nr:hypothetical protein [Gammaproteobacteria bacterium]MDH5308440.1 hypothetical protein [Gammaproteobacteria bacterium]
MGVSANCEQHRVPGEPGRAAAAAALLGGVFVFLQACSIEELAGIDMPEVPDDDVSLALIATIGSQTLAPMFGGGRYQLGYAAAVAARGGSVFVVDSAAGGVVRIDPSLTRAELLYPLGDPTTRGLHVTRDLLIYVVDRQERAVIELSDTGAPRRHFSDSSLLPAPVDLALTNWDATLVVADELTAQLVVFDSMGGPTAVLGSNIAGPRIASTMQAISGGGNGVYVLDGGLQEVVHFDLAGRPLGGYGEDDLVAPVAMTVDECGRVFVADGHPQGLFVGLGGVFGHGMRVPFDASINPAVTDLWIDGDELYVAAGAAGIQVYLVEPGCPR